MKFKEVLKEAKISKPKVLILLIGLALFIPLSLKPYQTAPFIILPIFKTIFKSVLGAGLPVKLLFPAFVGFAFLGANFFLVTW